ncbi:antirepressor regulating drug resistance protein [Terriglobus roseus DSM 18391]|uniref:Antirepressor regulating drug resistance protein n=1 Tax=Terriglobus roseus (strain DSM 18391 / NRRL B-41598 / KBS 63) TaxID=926566 RepID=I3ZEP3_TERRK|nr:M56 family metallopeptidase [Terriglobus roseus]AFL87711.1 antirepressor regulating drug resistance protein [Terriglobus roseus DSM 18391]
MTPVFAHLSIVVATGCIAGLWQGAALALLASALLRLTPKASPALRHTLLVAIFVAAAILPWLPSVTHVTASSTGTAPLRMAPWIATAIAAIWLTAAIARATDLVLAWKHLRRVRRNAVPVTIAGVDSFTAGDRRALLCLSSEVDSPAILGFFRPVLLLPEWLVPKLTVSELRQIALHECEHLRRRDDWINLLLQLGLVLVPLNPALHWLNRSIGIQRELACDAKVVATTSEPLAYAASLTHLAEQRMQRRSLRLALAAWGRKSELTQRVYALLSQRPAWTGRQSGMASATAAALLLTASAGLAHAPRLVRFADAPMSLAATQVPAITTVPSALTAAMVKASSTTAASTMHMVPATFTVKPQSKMRHSSAPKPQLKATLQPVQILPRGYASARFLQTAAQDAESNGQDSDDATVRFVTTEFTTPYVAVPVRNGWILIEL